MCVRGTLVPIQYLLQGSWPRFDGGAVPVPVTISSTVAHHNSRVVMCNHCGVAQKLESALYEYVVRRASWFLSAKRRRSRWHRFGENI